MSLVIVLVVVGLALWLINNYIPMVHTIKTILNIVVVVFVVVWVLKATGLWTQLSAYRL